MELVDNVKIGELMRPQIVALVGATEKAVWTFAISANFKAFDFQGTVYAVNREGKDVAGLQGYVSCQEIPVQVDTVYIIVPVGVVKDALSDAIAAGARAAVILTSGFSEAGLEGKKLQEEISAMARESGLVLLGPNSLGFINFTERRPLTSLQPQLPVIDGHVGLVSQSGAMANELMEIAHRHHIGLSVAVATGNEATLTTADIINFLVDDENTGCIAVYVESIQEATSFLAAAKRALDVGKPIVILKIGSSELTAKIAAAHTGAFVGNDRVFDAVCRQYGLLRVQSVEDLILTAQFMIDSADMADGVGVISISGGACGIIADNGVALDLKFPQFADTTKSKLQALLPGYASDLNPFDITGAVMAKPALFEEAIEIVAADPSIGLVLVVYPFPSDKSIAMSSVYEAIGRGFATIDKPGFLWSQSIRPVDQTCFNTLEEAGVRRRLLGLEAGSRAIMASNQWRQARAKPLPVTRPFSDSTNVDSPRPLGEREALDYLYEMGISVVPAKLATTTEEAVGHAKSLGFPVVLKVASADIHHKSEIGGVKLSLQDAEMVEAAFNAIFSDAKRFASGAMIDGILVSPMRASGVDMLIGIVHDPQWGHVMAVGLGGIWTELLEDTQLVMLPANNGQIQDALGRLKAIKILQGYRGAEPVDISELSDVIERIGNAALNLGPDLAALEVNPLRAFDGEFEALDALAIWNTSNKNMS